MSSIEELPESLGDADWITYTVDTDGNVPDAVQYVLDSPLWKNLSAVKAGHVIPIRYSESATYASAENFALPAIDKAFEKAFADELE